KRGRRSSFEKRVQSHRWRAREPSGPHHLGRPKCRLRTPGRPSSLIQTTRGPSRTCRLREALCGYTPFHAHYSGCAVLSPNGASVRLVLLRETTVGSRGCQG